MGDLPNADKPRKLLRWTESSEVEDDLKNSQDPGSENKKENSSLSNEGSVDEASEKSGSNSENPEATVPTKREAWYGAKMQRLKDSVAKLRKDLRDKERDYIRLKNKYNVSKRRQEQLQEDMNRKTEGKLDTDSEMEFLRLQLIEKEKEISKFRDNYASCIEPGEKGGKTKPEESCGIEDDVDVISLESCLGDSFLVRKYLNFHKDVRRWMLYSILGAACCCSFIALSVGSPLLSSIAVALWTLGLFCLSQERKELYRALKIKHLKKMREMSAEGNLLRSEKGKLEARKDELEKELAKEIQDKDKIISKFMSLSEKMVEETAKNNDLAQQGNRVFEDLQSERVRRRRAEERLEEVSAQVMLAKEADEVARCGDVCQELRDSLKLEQEMNEKLSRENQRLIEEIVALNVKEEKGRMERENEEIERQVVEKKEIKKDKEMVPAESEDEKEQDAGTRKPGTVKAENTVSKIQPSTESKIQPSTESKIQASVIDSNINSSPENTAKPKVLESNKGPSEIPTLGTDVKVKENGEVMGSRSCWLCTMNVPIETRLAVYVVLSVCLLLLFKLVLSSKIYSVVCLLSMTVVGILSYYRVAINSN